MCCVNLGGLETKCTLNNTSSFVLIFYRLWFANSVGYNLELRLELDPLVGQLASNPPPPPHCHILNF